MLTTEEIKRYKQIQSEGLPLGRDLISIREASLLFKVTFATISNLKAENPGTKVKDEVTWWIVGSIIMFDKGSLFNMAKQKGWIEEV